MKDKISDRMKEEEAAYQKRLVKAQSESSKESEWQCKVSNPNKKVRRDPMVQALFDNKPVKGRHAEVIENDSALHFMFADQLCTSIKSEFM